MDQLIQPGRLWNEGTRGSFLEQVRSSLRAGLQSGEEPSQHCHRSEEGELGEWMLDEFYCTERYDINGFLIVLNYKGVADFFYSSRDCVKDCEDILAPKR